MPISVTYVPIEQDWLYLATVLDLCSRRLPGHAMGAAQPLIPLTCNEIRRLWATITRQTHPTAHTDPWSHWRRLRQTHAKHSDY